MVGKQMKVTNSITEIEFLTLIKDSIEKVERYHVGLFQLCLFMAPFWGFLGKDIKVIYHLYIYLYLSIYV